MDDTSEAIRAEVRKEVYDDHIAILLNTFIEGFWEEIRCLKKTSNLGKEETAKLKTRVNEAMTRETLVSKKNSVLLGMIPEIRSHLSLYVYGGGSALKCLEKFCDTLVYCDDFKSIALCFANNFYH